jgi:hypothetical protein
MYILFKKSFVSINYQMFQKIIQDYRNFLNNFEYWKLLVDRKYFPNMKFIALKIFELNNIKMNYEIPLILTCRKDKELQDIWNILN